jgi:hypothetical protein
MSFRIHARKGAGNPGVSRFDGRTATVETSSDGEVEA